MASINTEWGNCITALLKRHNLTSRGARLRAGGAPSHTTIGDWADGVVPKDKELAYHFLSSFPRDEAIGCLRAANLPIPNEWRSSDDMLQNLQTGLRAKGRIPEKAIDEILAFARAKLKQYEMP